jgi:hypothetical protein
MNTTAASLINSITTNSHDLSSPVLIDYFGMNNINNTTSMNIIYNLYSSLINDKGVNVELLHNCYLTNRLDSLIHKKFTYNRTPYYSDFITMKLSLKNPMHLKNNIKPMKIRMDLLQIET